jgi:hypothetical protein
VCRIEIQDEISMDATVDYVARIFTHLLKKSFSCNKIVHRFLRSQTTQNYWQPTSNNHNDNLSDVCTKYQEAAKIVNLALQGLVSQCVPGANIIDLCEFGHTVMEAQASKLYTKKVDGKLIDRGVSFPVCISVNDVVCNHSPITSEERVS